MTVAQTKNVYLEKKILNYFQYMEVVIENTGQKVNSAHSQSKNRSSLDLKKGDLHDRISFKKFYEQNHFSGEGNSQLYAVCLKKKTKMHPFFI